MSSSMQAQDLTVPQREGGLTESQMRVKLADQALADLVSRLQGPEFEVVHPGRWRHLGTTHHVETGYSYGEGRVRVYFGGGKQVGREFTISGRTDDLDGFNELIPA